MSLGRCSPFPTVNPAECQPQGCTPFLLRTTQASTTDGSPPSLPRQDAQIPSDLKHSKWNWWCALWLFPARAPAPCSTLVRTCCHQKHSCVSGFPTTCTPILLQPPCKLLPVKQRICQHNWRFLGISAVNWRLSRLFLKHYKWQRSIISAPIISAFLCFSLE